MPTDDDADIVARWMEVTVVLAIEINDWLTVALDGRLQGARTVLIKPI